MNYAWNQAWTLFMRKRPAEALPHMERAVRLAPRNAEAQYDLAIIRLAAGDRDGARRAVDLAAELNPKLRAQAEKDPDLAGLRQ
jgi:Flp pilus assembly protein TadD